MDGVLVGAHVMIHNTHQCNLQDEWCVEKKQCFFWAIFLLEWDITRVISYECCILHIQKKRND
jgi:hypothetical protein